MKTAEYWQREFLNATDLSIIDRIRAEVVEAFAKDCEAARQDKAVTANAIAKIVRSWWERQQAEENRDGQ